MIVKHGGSGYRETAQALADALDRPYRDPRELAGGYRRDGLDEALARMAALLDALSDEACVPAAVGGAT